MADKDYIPTLSRRSLVKLASGSAIGSSAFGCARKLPVPVSRFSEADPKIFSQDEREFLAAVQNHLLPSEIDMPGARELHATEYLELALTGSDIDPDHEQQIKSGIKSLENLAQEKFRLKFTSLSELEREDALRAFEDTDDGYSWLRVVMGYTIEAYVGDPAYGGNVDELGWRSLGHHPGVPRPITIAKRR